MQVAYPSTRLICYTKQTTQSNKEKLKGLLFSVHPIAFTTLHVRVKSHTLKKQKKQYMFTFLSTFR